MSKGKITWCVGIGMVLLGIASGSFLMYIGYNEMPENEREEVGKTFSKILSKFKED